VICKWAKKLEIGRQLGGPEGQYGPLRFRREDVTRLTEELRRWDHLSPREPDNGEWGRLASLLAKQRGKRTGRKPAYADDEAELVRRLRSDDCSLGQIEVKTGLSRDQVRRILRLR
jgi:hypothetical protein